MKRIHTMILGILLVGPVGSSVFAQGCSRASAPVLGALELPALPAETTL